VLGARLFTGVEPGRIAAFGMDLLRRLYSKPSFKWYELGWSLLPVTLTAFGGAVGALCGVAGAGCNIALMRSDRATGSKYRLTASVSLVALITYILLVRLWLMPHAAGPAVEGSDLHNSPLLAAIEQADPATYGRIRDAMSAEEARGKSGEELQAAIAPYLGMVVKRYLPKASDQAILDFTQVMVLEIGQIGAKSADACYDFLFPRASAPPLMAAQYVSPEVSERDVMTAAAVIESGYRYPHTVPAKEEVASSLNLVVSQLVATYGSEDVVTFAKRGPLDHAKSCAMAGAMYKNVLALPDRDAVSLLRFLFAQNTAL